MASKQLTGKIAVITGASKGIGQKIAVRLAMEGCDCLLVARTEQTLAQSAREIIKLTGQRIETAAVDLSSLKGCEQASGTAIRHFGHVDILVNCAGATKAGTFLDLPDEDWMDGFDLKFHGAVRLSRLLWPSLASRQGTVINIGGAATYSPNPNFMIGGAVNVAMAHFSKALSLQGLKDDVNVNVVHPGMTVSDRMQTLLETQAAAEGITVAQAKLKNIQASGIRRLGQPEDVAELVAFLCSPQARHIQGVGIPIDGGATTGFH